MYDVGDQLLMVASDRVSTYDVVLPTPIPDKGKVLTGLSVFWFGRTEDIVPNHLLSTDVPDGGARPRPARAQARHLPRGVRGAGLPVRARAGRSTNRARPSAASICRPACASPTACRSRSSRPPPRRNWASTTRTSTSTAPPRSWATARRWRSCGASRSRCTRAGPSTRSARASSSPTPSSSSAATRTAASCSQTRCSPPTRRGSGPPTSTSPAAASRRSTSSSCATGWTRRAGTTRRPGPELPAEVVEATRAKYVEAYERIAGGAVPALAR